MQDLKENRIEYLQGLSDWFKNNEHDLIINLSFVCFWHIEKLLLLRLVFNVKLLVLNFSI